MLEFADAGQFVERLEVGGAHHGALAGEQRRRSQTGLLHADYQRLYALEVHLQFQRRQREQGQHQAGDPEAGDDLRFRPAQRFEVMVQRRHFENAFAVAQLVAAHLQDDGDGFQQ